MGEHKQTARRRERATAIPKIRRLDTHDLRQRFLAGLLIVFVLGTIGWRFWNWWIRPPAVEFDNLKYIQLLTTAISSRSPEMVSKVEAAVQQRFDAGQMSDTERAHFQELFALADAEVWEEADQECFTFAKAQLSRSRDKPPVEGHSHDHSHKHEHPAPDT